MAASIRYRGLGLALLVMAALPAASFGAMIGFYGITNNSAASTAIGQAQLWTDVTSPLASQVLFTFGNTGLGQCTITQIYFEQGPLSDLLQIIESPGVGFHEASPGVLPGGNDNGISFSTVFEADADKPAPKNGVNSSPDGSETVGLLFSLAPNRTYQDVLRLLANEQFHVGLHVENFADGQSESFLNERPPPPTVPEPATAMTMLAGLAFVGTRWRQNLRWPT